MSQVYRLQSQGPIDVALSSQPVTEHPFDRRAVTNGWVSRVSRIDQDPVLVKVRNEDTQTLLCEITPLTDRQMPSRDSVIHYLRRKFSLDLDLEAFYRFLVNKPTLAHLPNQLPGLRPILKDTLFESLVLAIIDQQVNVTFASRLKSRFLELCGHHYHVGDQILWLFPTAEAVARMKPDDLRNLQLTRMKAQYIVQLAEAFQREPQWEQPLGDDDAVVRQLCQLRGVGPWTAEYAAMVGLGLKNTVPAADIALMRMVQNAYGLDERPNEETVRRLAEDWSPWKGLVTFYLWHLEDI